MRPGRTRQAGTAVSIAMTSDPGGDRRGLYSRGDVHPDRRDDAKPVLGGSTFRRRAVTFGTVTEISEPDSTIGNSTSAALSFTKRPSRSGTGSAAPTIDGYRRRNG